MDWEICELSGAFKAFSGGYDYWISYSGGFCLEKIEPTFAGPEIKVLGSFKQVDEAMLAAEEDAGCE